MIWLDGISRAFWKPHCGQRARHFLGVGVPLCLDFKNARRADAKSVANNNDAHQQHQANNAAPRDLIISLRPLSDKMFVLRQRPAKAFGGALTGLTTTTHWSKSLWLKTDYRNSPPFASPQHHAL
jgi:hypothetical protein